MENTLYTMLSVYLFVVTEARLELARPAATAS